MSSASRVAAMCFISPKKLISSLKWAFSLLALWKIENSLSLSLNFSCQQFKKFKKKSTRWWYQYFFRLHNEYNIYLWRTTCNRGVLLTQQCWVHQHVNNISETQYPSVFMVTWFFPGCQPNWTCRSISSNWLLNHGH